MDRKELAHMTFRSIEMDVQRFIAAKHKEVEQALNLLGFRWMDSDGIPVNYVGIDPAKVVAKAVLDALDSFRECERLN